MTSCVALRSLFVYFGFSVFVVMCGNGARVLCRARSCFVLSLIVHERATSEDTFKGCIRMSRRAQTRDFWFFIRGVFRVRCGVSPKPFWETFVAVTRSPETRHVVVLASSVRVVSCCSSRPSACRAWPTLNMKHKFAHIFVERTCDVMMLVIDEVLPLSFLFVACVVCCLCDVSWSTCVFQW